MPYGSDMVNAPNYAGGGLVPRSNYGNNGGGGNPNMAGALGAFGANAGQMLADYDNPADAAKEYMNQIPGQLDKYYDPYINRGNRSGDILETQYGNLLNDPGTMLNKIGGGYQQSPGFKFALEQALKGASRAAAAGGMAGSPMHEQQNMELATNFANQDYNNWISKALGMYGSGLSGEQGMYGIGANAGMQKGQDMASYLANQAKLAYEGQNAENQHSGGMWGSLLGTAGTVLGSMYGGPIGGAAGGAAGSAIGNWIGE